MGHHRSTTRFEQLVLSLQHKEVGRLSRLEQPNLTVQLLFGRFRRSLGSGDPLPRSNQPLKSVPHLGINRLFHAGSFQAQPLLGDRGLG